MFDAISEIPDSFTPGSLGLLQEKLTKALAAKFQQFGVQLELELSEIESLSYKNVNMELNLHNMLDEWRRKGEWRDGSEPLRLIFRALESNAVREISLLRKLREKWKACECELLKVCCLGDKILFFSAVA